MAWHCLAEPAFQLLLSWSCLAASKLHDWDCCPQKRHWQVRPFCSLLFLLWLCTADALLKVWHGTQQDGMAEALETVGSYPDLLEGPPAWHKPGDARYRPCVVQPLCDTARVWYSPCVVQPLCGLTLVWYSPCVQLQILITPCSCQSLSCEVSLLVATASNA